MDKRIFEIRRKLPKQVISILILLIFTSCTAQNSKFYVFEKDKAVGKLNDETKIQCKECYIIQKVRIYDKYLSVKIPVSTITVKKNTSVFRSDYEISFSDISENILEISNTFTSQNFKFYIVKNKNDLFLDKIEEISNTSFRLKISKNDFVDVPATQICQNTSKSKLPLKDFLILKNYLNSDVFKNKCFKCPLKYSIEECLKMKAENKIFSWEQ